MSIMGRGAGRNNTLKQKKKGNTPILIDCGVELNRENIEKNSQ